MLNSSAFLKNATMFPLGLALAFNVLGAAEVAFWGVALVLAAIGRGVKKEVVAEGGDSGGEGGRPVEGNAFCSAGRSIFSRGFRNMRDHQYAQL